MLVAIGDVLAHIGEDALGGDVLADSAGFGHEELWVTVVVQVVLCVGIHLRNHKLGIISAATY